MAAVRHELADWRKHFVVVAGISPAPEIYYAEKLKHYSSDLYSGWLRSNGISKERFAQRRFI